MRWSRPASAPAAALLGERRRGAGRRPPGRWLGGSAARAPSCAAARFPRAGRAETGVYANFARDLPGDASDLARVDPASASAPRCASGAGLRPRNLRRQRPPPPRRPFPRLFGKRPQSRHAGLPARLVRGGARRIRRRGRHRHGLEGRPPARRPAQLLLQGRLPALLGRRHPRGAATGAPTTSSITR